MTASNPREGILWLWRKSKLLNLMTLITSFRVHDGFLVFCDGNVYEYLEDDTKKMKFKSDSQQKVFQVAKNVVIGVAGTVDEKLLDVFLKDIKKIFGNKKIYGLTSYKDRITERLEHYSEGRFSCMVVCASDMLYILECHSYGGEVKTDDITYSKSFVHMGQDLEHLRNMTEKHGISAVDYDEAIKDSVEMFRQTHKIREHVGGKIFAWHVTREQAKPVDLKGIIDKV